MCEVITYAQAVQYDPTRTTGLRNAFAREMTSRFKELIIAIYEGVYKNDAFGLRQHKIHTLQMTPPVQGAFAFSRSQAKVSQFIKWLEQQVELGILTVRDLDQVGRAVEAVWTNRYLYDSYRRGVLRARYEMIRAGMKIPSVDDQGGIGMVLSAPIHIDRMGLIFTRVFTDLRGITNTMDAEISRILSQGIADGDGPLVLARKMVAVINGKGIDKLGMRDSLGRHIPAMRRAETLARTELIRAHHLATIQEYRNWELLDIRVKAEWATARDDRVCPKCAALDGKVFTLDEIEPMIPLHPNCRCIALPWDEAIIKYR